MMSTLLKDIEALANKGEFEKAEALVLKSKIRRSPAMAILAAIAMKRGQHQKAEVYFTKALEEEPDNVIANGNYASLLLLQKKPKRALKYAEKAVKLAPHTLQFALYLVACYADADRFADAADVLRPFAEQTNPDSKALLNYATVLRADLRPEEALKVLARAQELYPDDQECQRAIADAYAEVDPAMAQTEFKKLLEERPDHITLQWNMSFVELRLRNFEQGWKMYEAGLSDKVGKIGRPLPAQVGQFPIITDLVQLNHEKWTIFSAEQGIGDQVLFYGALEEALLQVDKAILVGEDRMIPILKRSFPQVGVFSYGFASTLNKQKYRINGVFPIGSLMKNFRSDENSFQRHRRQYIYPDEQKVAKFQAIFKKNFGESEVIGISWRGGYWDRQKRTKSFEFELFSKIIDQRRRYVSLQYGNITEEREYCKKNNLPVTFIDGIDFKKDIDSWLALACACNSITSVSTALVHFAGAAGKRVNVIIGDYQAPFIWGTDSGPSLPYINTIIYRKSKAETADEFMERVKGALA